MKRFLSLFTAALLMTSCLFACSSENVFPARSDDKIQIVTTIFPIYDWVKCVLGENPGEAEVTMLLDTGVDLHSFQPTAKDILKISTSDLFIYVGGESDKWAEGALQEVPGEGTAIVLLDVLGDAVKEEEIVEGMQEEEHDHGQNEGEDQDREHGESEDHDHEHGEGEAEYDEHVWLSLRNAAVLVESISEALQAIDPVHADLYKENTASYLEELKALDAEYQAAVSEASFTTLLFGDRFPFRYLTDDYGLDYYAAFAGCSAETEASFETIVFLSQKADELSLPAVMTIEGTDHRIAETIVRNTKTKDQQILVLDSMQSITAKDVDTGVSYLAVMEKNLSVLKDALKCGEN